MRIIEKRASVRLLPLYPWIVLLMMSAGAVATSFAEKPDASCAVCGTRKEVVQLRYHDGSSTSLCSLRCAIGSIAAYREKDVVGMMMREHASGTMIDAKKAFWVIGSAKGKAGPAVFSSQEDAERFALKHGGRVEMYDQAMKAVVSGLYGQIAKTRRSMKHIKGDDRDSHPECLYCGMDRAKYAFSRMLVVYDDGKSVGLCSIHCAAIDLALKPRLNPARIMVAAYDSHRLIDAEKAVWVLGGEKQGVMSIRGKWAFEKKKEALVFIKSFGGNITGFPEVMQAAFEDMWEILK